MEKNNGQRRTGKRKPGQQRVLPFQAERKVEARLWSGLLESIMTPGRQGREVTWEAGVPQTAIERNDTVSGGGHADFGIRQKD